MTVALVITLIGAQAIIKVSGHQHRPLAGGYEMEIETFRGGLPGGQWLFAQCCVKEPLQKIDVYESVENIGLIHHAVGLRKCNSERSAAYLSLVWHACFPNWSSIRPFTE